jgi:hypothetical protein
MFGQIDEIGEREIDGQTDILDQTSSQQNLFSELLVIPIITFSKCFLFTAEYCRQIRLNIRE